MRRKESLNGRLQKFRPQKRNVDDLLDPDVLDDETRKLLMKEVERPPPPPILSQAASPPFKRATGVPSIHSPSSLTSTPAELPALKSLSGTPRRRASNQLQALPSVEPSFPSQLRTQVKSVSGDLVAAMANRLTDLEKKHHSYQSELKEMYDKYRHLNDMYQNSLHQKTETENVVVVLYEENKDLKKELSDMKRRLEDYELHWKGSGDAGNPTPTVSPRRSDRTGNTSEEMPASKFNLYDGNYSAVADGVTTTPGQDALCPSPCPRASGHALDGFAPVHFTNTAAREGKMLYSSNHHTNASGDSSIPSKAAHESRAPVNVKQLKENARILSDYVGWKGIVSDGRRAGIHERDVVRVVLYQNGICVNNGPFRPYSWPLCVAFLRDLEEGYYPYEFKDKYPDGFPIEVTDQTGVAWGIGGASKHSDNKVPMEGGKRLGGNAGGGRIHTLADGPHLGSNPVSKEDFLSKLPNQHVTSTGYLVNVRAGVADLLSHGPPKGDRADANLTVRHVTSAEAAYRETHGKTSTSPTGVDDSIASGSLSELVGVRIRLPSGQKVTLYMNSSNTMADVRIEFVKAIPDYRTMTFEFCQAFPKQVFTDHGRTLKELGLHKTCTLMIYKPLKWVEGGRSSTAGAKATLERLRDDEGCVGTSVFDV